MSMPSSSDRGRDQARQLAGLEQLLDHRPLLARERAVVATRAQLLAPAELVEAQREPLGAAAVVDEHDRRAVRADQLEQLGVDRRPDRAPRRLAAARADRASGAGAASGSTIDSTGTRISRSSSLRTPVSTIAARRACGPTMNRPTSSSGFWVADRPIRWTSAPGGLRSSRSSVSARCAPRLVEATAWISSTMHHRVPSNSSCARAGQHQVQRLGRRDQDVGRLAQHRLALALRRVAGADRDRQLGADPAQRRAQVAVDVVGQRLQRRDVDEADAGARAVGGRRRRPAGRSPTGTRPASCPTRSGAEISTCSPEAIAGHACAWAGVGASNAPRNHSRVRGLKAESGTKVPA